MLVVLRNHLPQDGGWHRGLHVVIADVGHLTCEQVVDLNATITLRRSDVLIVIIKSDAISWHINGAQSDLGLYSEFGALRVFITICI